MRKLEHLNRSFSEIERAYESAFTKEKDVKHFYWKIVDFVEHIEGDDVLVKLFKKHRNDAELNSLEEDLLDKGEIILEKLRTERSRIIQVIKEKDVKIPTAEEFYKDKRTSGLNIYSLTTEESIGTQMDYLRDSLKKDAQIDINEVPRLVSTYNIIILDLETLRLAHPPKEAEKLNKYNLAYKTLLDKINRRRDYLSILDYQEVVQVKDALTEDERNFERGISFKFTKSYKLASPLNEGWMTIRDNKEKIIEERNKYFKNAERVHSLFINLLEAKEKSVKDFLGWINQYWKIDVVKDFFLYIIAYIFGLISPSILKFITHFSDLVKNS